MDIEVGLPHHTLCLARLSRCPDFLDSGWPLSGSAPQPPCAGATQGHPTHLVQLFDGLEVVEGCQGPHSVGEVLRGELLQLPQDLGRQRL